jgi:ketosteroid isomerase-like protein
VRGYYQINSTGMMKLTVCRGVVAAGVVAALAAGCQPPASGGEMTAARKAAIADTLKGLVASAYDLSKGDAVRRLMSLYPDSGPVVSAASGHITTSRDSLEAEIRAFWDNVGRNMRDPHWIWGQTFVDVLGPNAAVLTATYRVPHIQPNGQPHVIGGAWTAVFERRHGKWMIVHEHLSDDPTVK